jgi:hypothetical protein
MKVTYFPTLVSRVGETIHLTDLQEGEVGSSTATYWFYKMQGSTIMKRGKYYRTQQPHGRWVISAFNEPQYVAELLMMKVIVVEGVE